MECETMTQTNRIDHLNGTLEPRTKRQRKAKAEGTSTRPVLSVTRTRKPVTVWLGCGIPVLSLSLSHQGGELLAAEHYGLGVGSLILCGVVLCLSLSHLAAAIEDITHSAQWQAWMLAIAVDAALVCAELVRVAGQGGLLQWGMMGALTATSAALNVWAFFRSHR